MKINKLCLLTALLCIATVISPRACYSLPELGRLTIRSPDENYELKLADVRSGHCVLILSDKEREIARYPFEGYLVSAVWSPKNKYVAVNNHAGFSAWCVWIVSVSDGEIRTVQGSKNTIDYDHCYDDSCTANGIAKLAAPQIKKLYPAVDKDVLNDRGSMCVAYKWKNENSVLLFSNYDFQKLSSERGKSVQIFTDLSVGKTLDFKNSRFDVKSVKNSDAEQIPEFVNKISVF